MTDGRGRIATYELFADADLRLKAHRAQFLLVCPLILEAFGAYLCFLKSLLNFWLGFYYIYNINPVKNCQFYDVYSSHLEIYLASLSRFYNTQI